MNPRYDHSLCWEDSLFISFRQIPDSQACPAESYSGHKKRAVFKTALVPQYNILSNYIVTIGKQVVNLPQAPPLSKAGVWGGM